MRIVRDLFGNTAPIPLDVVFNADTDADGNSACYKGQFVKITDFDDIDQGTFITKASETTAMENWCGILAEDLPASADTYLLDSSTGDFVRKKIFPISNHTIIRGEYSQKDAAGSSNTDTGIYTASASTTGVCPTMTTADTMIGGWIYFLTGNNANYLHYVTDNTTGEACTFGTATKNAGASGDTCLVIQPPMTRRFLLDATYSGLKSEIVPGSLTTDAQGLDYYVEAPGLAHQKLTRDLDGLYIPNARFFHDFFLPGAVVGESAWTNGVAVS